MPAPLQFWPCPLCADTVIVLLAGVGLGFGELAGNLSPHSPRLWTLGTSVARWSALDPHVILYVFLPILLFDSAFSVDFHIFRTMPGGLNRFGQAAGSVTPEGNRL